jgi:integrase
MEHDTEMGRLTNKIIENLPVQSKGYIFWDGETKGFGIRININGKKTFILKYRIGQGRRAKIKKPVIGTFGVIKTEQARHIAKQWLVEASKGIDPCESDKDQTTIKDFCDVYLKHHAEVKKKQSSAIEDKRLMRLQILPHFGKLRVQDVTRAMIIRHHQSLNSTPYMANRFLALFSTMMNLAEKWEYRLLNTNPCIHVDRYKEKPRETFLSMEQLERIGSAMRQLKDVESKYILAAIKMLMLTGCRTGEILNLRWEQIDFQTQKMNLPDTKTGARSIHLSPASIDILHSLPSTEGYVFKSSIQNKKLTTIRHVWKKICRLAGINDVRVHDLRHTYASYAVSKGYSLPIVSKMLGHADIKTTQRYAHLMDDPVNLAIDKTSDLLDKLVKAN